MTWMSKPPEMKGRRAAHFIVDSAPACCRRRHIHPRAFRHIRWVARIETDRLCSWCQVESGDVTPCVCGACPTCQRPREASR